MNRLDKIAHEITDELNVRCNLKSQNIVAKETGISRAYLGQLLSGDADITGLTLKKLYQLFPFCEIHLKGSLSVSENISACDQELYTFLDTLSAEERHTALAILKLVFPTKRQKEE